MSTDLVSSVQLVGKQIILTSSNFCAAVLVAVLRIRANPFIVDHSFVGYAPSKMTFAVANLTDCLSALDAAFVSLASQCKETDKLTMVDPPRGYLRSGIQLFPDPPCPPPSPPATAL